MLSVFFPRCTEYQRGLATKTWLQSAVPLRTMCPEKLSFSREWVVKIGSRDPVTDGALQNDIIEGWRSRQIDLSDAFLTSCEMSSR